MTFGGQIHDEGHLSHQHKTVRWLSQWVRRALGAQFVIFAGLTLLLVWQNHSLSPASFVINLFAIPWILLLTVPAVLLGMLLQLVGSIPLTCCCASPNNRCVFSLAA